MSFKNCCIKYNNRVYVRGHKYVLGPTQTHFSPSRWAITINITLEGIEEIKTAKNDNKTLRRIFFSPAL